MNAQSDGGKVPLPNLATQLIEAHPSSEHQVIDDPLIVRHVVDKPLKRRLPHPLGFCQLWNHSAHSSGRAFRLCSLFLLGSLIFMFFARFRLCPEAAFDR